MGKGPTFYIETFGCQMNVHDSEKVAGALLARGYQPAASTDETEFVVINTCAIRDKAEHKVFSRLGEFKSAAAEGKKRVAVIGCMAQLEGERIFEAAPFVSLVAGSASYRRLPEMLVQLEQGGRRVTGLDYDDGTFETEITRRSNPYRAYITIIEGCDKHCTFCVVPTTRGPERSRTSESILEEARRLAGDGYTEIQMLGQTVNSYRDPGPRRLTFSELLADVAAIPGVRRVRFATSHPRDFTPDIVEVIDSTPTLCNHVHLPVQSGSSEVLRRMNRTYTREQYLDRIALIRSAGRAISITTDIIVGFPGEATSEFEETLTLLDAAQFDGTFTFLYSPRPKTPAMSYPNPVDEEEKVRRLMALQVRQKEIQQARNDALVGQEVEVLIENQNERLSQWVGRTTTNKVVNFAGGQEELGGYARVLITRAGPNSLVGEKVSAATS